MGAGAGDAGFDNAVFAGDFDSYTIAKLGNGVMRLAGPDGTDTLANVEQLGFANATIIDDRADRLGEDDDDATLLPVWMTQGHNLRAPKTLWN